MFESILHLFQRFLPAVVIIFVAGAVLIYIVFGDFTLSCTLFFASIYLGALPSPARSGGKTSVFLAWSLGLLCVLLISIIGFNYVLNPLGIYPTRYFEPLVLDHDRVYRYKVQFYDDMNPAPEVVVLGSSRSFTMPPSYITGVTGLPAFNASVQGGTLDDFLRFTRHMIDEGKSPRAVIVGLSTEIMISKDREISGNTEKMRQLLSWDQTKESVRLLKMEIGDRPPGHYYFDKDGLAHFNEMRPLNEAVKAYIALPLWGELFTGISEVSSKDTSRLTALLTLCQANNIKVIIYLPPWHPQMLAVYESQNFPQLKTDYLDVLTTLQGQYDFTFYDMTTIESFDGNETMFHDGVHPNEEAARLILDRVLEDVPQD